MKVRDSGMPDQAAWEDFFDSRQVLTELKFPGGDAEVVDFGCGFGTFSLAAATLTRGTVHALDIEPEMVRTTAARAASLGLNQVRAVERDFLADGTGLADATVDYAMLFNILHAERPESLLAEAFRVLRPGGTLAAIHWVHDARTPRGPALSIRPRPEQCQAWIRACGFELTRPMVDLPPYHFGVVGCKPHTAGS